jgi:hypothetical protein
MRTSALGIAAVALAIVASAGLSFHAFGQSSKATSRQAATAPTTSFREDIVPILKGRCMDCHQPGAEGFETSGLDLRNYEGVIKGTKFGPMVIPGDPEGSNLMALVDWRVSPEIRMPHGKKKLSTCDRDVIRRWIMEGAKDN